MFLFIIVNVFKNISEKRNGFHLNASFSIKTNTYTKSSPQGDEKMLHLA